jgi:hypothetical protein
MKERKQMRTFSVWAGFFFLSLLLNTGLFEPTSGFAAATPLFKSVDEAFTGLSTSAVDGVARAPEAIGWPLKGNPKLGSSLNQLLGPALRRSFARTIDFAARHHMVLLDNRVQVTIVTTEEAVDEVRYAVEAVGGEYQLHYKDLLQALVPMVELEKLANRPDIQIIREPHRVISQSAMDPVPLVGAQTAEGVAASNAPAWHALSYDGTGVRVAVIDAGFTGYEGLLGSDLPGSVTTYDWTGTGMGGTEHGTACGEIVYDMAPGIAMDFHKVSTEVEIGNAVDQAISDGVDIISMSLILLLNGPGDGSGSLADIVSDARSNGIFFVVGAGNNAEHAWSGFFNNDGSDFHLWASGQNVNYFGPGDGSAYVIPAGFQILVGLHWDDWTVVDQDYDMILVYWDGDSWEYVTESSNVQNGGAGQTPQELIAYVTPVEGPYGVVVVKSNAIRDVCLRLLASHLGLTLDRRVSERSLVFPGDSPDAITVGAVDVTSYNLEVYSSRGPTFGPGGACAGGSTKPDITAYARISTVSFGPKMFAGTSPAIPHVAGAAALLFEAFPDYTVDELQADLEANAIDRGSSGKDNLYGSGRLYLGNPPGITISGTVRDISDENNSVVPGARVSVVEYEPYRSAVCDGDGSFEITNVPPNEKMHIVIRGPSGGDVEYAHTYSPYFTTGTKNIVEEEVPILQKSETDGIVTLISANPNLGIVGGAVETPLGDEFEGVDGVKITLTTMDGAPINAPVVYRNAGGDWDPDLEETSVDGGFAIYNVEAVPRDVRVVAQKDGWSFGLIEASVYPYKASPEAVTVAPVVGQAGGGGAPVGGGGGGGGGCFISTSQRDLSHSPLLW